MTEVKPKLTLKLPISSVKLAEMKALVKKALEPEKPILIPKEKQAKPIKTPQTPIVKKVVETKEELPPSNVFLIEPQELGKLYQTVRKEFPGAFPPKGEPPRILAIGIHKELSEKLKLSVTKTKIFCKIYCNRKIYIDLRIPGAKRYDLNGTIVSEV